MNPYNFSKNTQSLINYVTAGQHITMLNSPHNFQTGQFISGLLKQELKNGKSFLLLGKKNGFLKVLKTIIEESNLQSVTYFVNQPLQSNAEAQETDHDLLMESVRSQILYQFKTNKLTELRDTYNEGVFGEFNRSKLAELLFLARSKTLDFDLDLDLNPQNYQFNKKEFWYLRGRVEKAAQYFDNTYTYLKSSDELSDDVYRDFHIQQNREIVLNYLEKFIEDARSIFDAYKKLFLSIKNRLQSSYLDKIQNLKSATEQLELELEKYKVDVDLAPSRKAFSRTKDPLELQKQEVRIKYEQLLDILESAKIFSLKPPINSWTPDIEGLNVFIDLLKKNLKNAYPLIKKKVENQLAVLNSSNFDAPELSEYYKAQEELIYTLNGSKLFNKNFQNLNVSAWKNYEFIQTIYTFLKKNQNFLLNNALYATWRSFEYSLEPKALQLIEALHQKPTEDWVNIFELWYFNSLFTKFHEKELEDLKPSYISLEETKFINNSFDKNRITQFWEQERFKIENQKDKQFLNAVKEDDLDGPTMIRKFPKAFKSHFPVAVFEEHIDTKLLIDSGYDYLIIGDGLNVPSELLGNSHFQGILYLHNTEIDQEMADRIYHSNNYTGKKSFTLPAFHIPNNMENSDLLRDQILKSKVLVNILNEISWGKGFYSAKNFSIISCLSPFCTRLFNMEIEDLLLKPLKYDHLDSGIVEDIILKEDDAKFLLIQDGFLDANLDMEWQISMMNMIERMGIKVINVNTFLLAKGTKKSILDFIPMNVSKATVSNSPLH